MLARLAGQDAVVKTVTAIAASTQDAIKLAGRAGGTSSYVATLTPGTMSASRTITVPDLTGTMAVSGAGQTVTFGVGIIGTDPGGSELLRVGGDVRTNGTIIVGSGSNPFYVTGGASGFDIGRYAQGAAISVDANLNVGIGTAPTAGNGAIQLATHTTKAGGIALGTDCFLYRSAAGVIQTDDQLAMVGGKYFYLRGDASTDGSVRISSQSSGTATIEKRSGGSWTAMESWA